MQIKLKINGRPGSPENFGTAVEDAVFTKIKEQMTQKLANIRCPDHNQSPKLEFQGDSLKNTKFARVAGGREKKPSACSTKSDVIRIASAFLPP